MFFSTDGLALEILDVFLINRKKETRRTTSNRKFSVMSLRLSGKAHMYQNEDTYTLDEFNMLYIPKLCTYSQDTSGERIIAIHMNVYGFETDKIEVVAAPQGAKHFFQNIYRIWARKEKNYKYICQIMLMKFLMELPSQEDTLDIYLQQKLADPKLTVAQLAKQQNVSEQYFRRDFRKRYGVPPSQYINNARISYAKKILQTDYYTVAEVARMTGFDDANYFCTVFKKRVGKTPLEYKKSKNQPQK